MARFLKPFNNKNVKGYVTRLLGDKNSGGVFKGDSR